MSDSLWPHELQPSRLLHPWDLPGKSTGVGCHCLLHTYALENENLYSHKSLYTKVYSVSIQDVARGHQRADTLKPYSQKISQSNHTEITALSNSMKLSHACGATQDGSWWRGLTECGPLEKGMASYFSILALRTPWTVWKGQMIGYRKRNFPGH